MDRLRSTYAEVRKENIAGRLYPIPDDPVRRSLLDALVTCRLATVVAGTPTSIGGYVIHRAYDGADEREVGCA